MLLSVGAKVTWLNNRTNPVSGEAKLKGYRNFDFFGPHYLSAGESESYVFDEVGRYDYTDMVRRYVGVIIVE